MGLLIVSSHAARQVLALAANPILTGEEEGNVAPDISPSGQVAPYGFHLQRHHPATDNQKSLQHALASAPAAAACFRVRLCFCRNVSQWVHHGWRRAGQDQRPIANRPKRNWPIIGSRGRESHPTSVELGRMPAKALSARFLAQY